MPLNPEKLLGDIEQFVADSRAMLEQGAMMDLAGLENRVMLLCEEVLLLSKEDRARWGERLQKLMADLTSLSEEITAARDAVGEQLRQLPNQKKAHAAYKIINSADEEEEQ